MEEVTASKAENKKADKAKAANKFLAEKSVEKKEKVTHPTEFEQFREMNAKLSLLL